MDIRGSEGAQGAPRQELLPGLLLLFLAAGIGILALYRTSLPPYLAQLGFEVAAPLFLAAGALISAYETALARARGVRPHKRIARHKSRPLPRYLELAQTHLDRVHSRVINIDWIGDWFPLAVMLTTAGLALALEYRGWKMAVQPPSLRADQWLAGCLICICFPLLVLERLFGVAPVHKVPEANAISLMLRLVLANILLLSLSFFCRWLALNWWLPLTRIAVLFTALVAAELLLRNASYFFMPLPPLATRRGRGESLAASLLRLQRPSLSAMNASVSRQIGIDLGRSWALGFIRRAAVPALIGLAAAAWLMTGLTALGLNDRAVYEAFGRPQAVFHSGLHAHLPWPFGTLKPVEYGVVHEIPIVFPAESANPSESAASPPSTSSSTTTGSAGDPIEGVPPESAERLWDATHPSEASYLVASNRNGRETFEVVNIDLQILYRVGLSDQAAYDAAYSVDDSDALIRAAAGRMLAQYFARYTIPDVLGQNREQFIRGFQRELQARLDALSSGIDILGVVIEAIHPPAQAATAYQDVQAAGIRSEAAVAVAKGSAVRAVISSQSEADTMRDAAHAAATELVDQAKVDTALFAGDVAADHRDGAAFLFERRLSVLAKAMRPDAPITILDNRFLPGQAPVIDFRPGGSAVANPVPAQMPGQSEDDEQ